jgi:hypothetical protein
MRLNTRVPVLPIFTASWSAAGTLDSELPHPFRSPVADCLRMQTGCIVGVSFGLRNALVKGNRSTIYDPARPRAFNARCCRAEKVPAEQPVNGGGK